MKKKSVKLPNDVAMEEARKAMANAHAPTVIRHAGQLNWVEVNGERIERQEEIYMPEYGMVKCAPTDNHFIYRYMKRKGWTTFCTCGSPAVIIGYDAYKQMASPQGMMLVCFSMAMSGRHADGGQ